jgi:hypothetical protein
MIASSEGLDSRHEVDLIAGDALKLERLSRVASTDLARRAIRAWSHADAAFDLKSLELVLPPKL